MNEVRPSIASRRHFLQSTTGAALAALGPTSRSLAEPAKSKPLDRASVARTLAGHRVAKIEARRVQDQFPRSIGPNGKGNPVGTGAGFQVRVATTNQGATGWAMSSTKDEDAQKLVGARLDDLFDLDAGTTDRVPQEIDRVFFDLVGNILSRPVYELLGGAGPRKVWLYTGAIYLEDVMPPEKPRGIQAVVAACKQDYEAGYRAFKLKLGRGFRWMPKADGLKRDIEVTRTVREQFPDCRVLVDANDTYTVEEMIGFVKAVADCDLYWIEEPFEENRDDLKRLREAMARFGCKALIADGEARKALGSKLTRYGGYTQGFVDRLFALAAEKLVDVFLLDLGTLGFTRWRQVMPELVKAGVQASPHTWMWTPRPFYAAHLAAGVGNVPIIEGIPGKAREIDYSAYRMEDGRLLMPDGPGFGLRLRR
jgi:L-alanine-DL-glutamate epimerase-like enolase superfamily enzyme